MAKKDWEVAYKKDDGITDIYRNKKKHQYIPIGAKQLGSFDGFKEEKYPFLVEDSGHPVRHEKWFDTPREAISYLNEYMRTH